LDALSLFVLSFALAMNGFSLAIANSSLSGKVLPGISVKAAFAFGSSHFVFGYLGYFLGGLLAPAILGIELYTSIAFLLILGIKVLFQATRVKPETKVFDINQTRVIMALSVALGMNALLVGLVLGFLDVQALTANLLTFFLVSFFTLFGLAGGHRLGMAFARNVAILGGVLFIAAALRMVITLIMQA